MQAPGIRRFLTGRLGRRHQPWFAILIDGDERKRPLRNLVLRLIGPAAPPSFDSNCQRRTAYSQNVGIKTDFIPDKDRLMKNHTIDSHSDGATARTTHCCVAPSHIHLRH